jgi:hypothetical protein
MSPLPLNGRPNTTLIGIAGVHHVVSELSRRGLVALPTTRNIAGYDVVVATVGGGRHANVQVKASAKRVSFFRMPPSSKVRAGGRDWYVFLRWLPREGRYEGFLLSGREARKEVARGERFQEKRMKAGTRKAVVPPLYVGRKVAARAEKWREAWNHWTLQRK